VSAQETAAASPDWEAIGFVRRGAAWRGWVLRIPDARLTAYLKPDCGVVLNTVGFYGRWDHVTEAEAWTICAALVLLNAGLLTVEGDK